MPNQIEYDRISDQGDKLWWTRFSIAAWQSAKIACIAIGVLAAVGVFPALGVFKIPMVIGMIAGAIMSHVEQQKSIEEYRVLDEAISNYNSWKYAGQAMRGESMGLSETQGQGTPSITTSVQQTTGGLIPSTHEMMPAAGAPLISAPQGNLAPTESRDAMPAPAMVGPLNSSQMPEETANTFQAGKYTQRFTPALSPASRVTQATPPSARITQSSGSYLNDYQVAQTNNPYDQQR